MVTQALFDALDLVNKCGISRNGGMLGSTDVPVGLPNSPEPDEQLMVLGDLAAVTTEHTHLLGLGTILLV